jgi:hypothetical protein
VADAVLYVDGIHASKCTQLNTSRPTSKFDQ